MKEITRDNDLFKLRLMKQLLESRGIYAVIMDEHIGGLYHGVGNMYARLMVSDGDIDEAVAIIKETEEGA